MSETAAAWVGVMIGILLVVWLIEGPYFFIGFAKLVIHRVKETFGFARRGK